MIKINILKRAAWFTGLAACLVTPITQAHWHHHGHPHWHPWHHHWHPWHRHNATIAFGAVAGIIAGAAIASRYHPAVPQYYQPHYAPGYSRRCYITHYADGERVERCYTHRD